MNRTCTKRRALSVLTILSLAISPFVNSLLAQAPQQVSTSTQDVPTFHTQTSEVQLTFSATDQNDRVIGNLTASDFAVVDKDLIVRNFRSFTRAEYTRLDVAILLDNSDSVAPRLQKELAQMLNLIAETSGVPEESISVITFHGTQPKVICHGNCRKTNPANLITVSSQGGMTPLYDSLSFAADLLAESNDLKARRALILLSDGEDTVSRNSAGEAVGDLVANNVQVYTLDVNSSTTRGAMFLRKLAVATGGRSFRLNDGASKVADAVLADFHASYQVTYRVPASGAGFHNVRIQPTHNLNLNFRCRQGYVEPSGR